MHARALVLALLVAGPARALDAPSERRPAPASAPVRTTLALGVVGATYATAWAFVSAAWWSHGSSRRFRFHDEGAFGLDTYAGGADKLGHFYANYFATRLYTGLLEWAELSRSVSSITATALTASFFTLVEVKDGYQPNYGFSLGDFAANVGGQAAALGFIWLPELTRVVSVRLAYLPSREYLRQRSESSLNVPEDYSGQTYLFAFHLAALTPLRREPALRALSYLDVTLGYATRGFQPQPPRPEPVRQIFSLGLSVNVPQLLDDAYGRSSARLPTALGALRFATDAFELPGTRVPLVELERVGP